MSDLRTYFAARPTWFLGLVEVDDWVIKAYAIAPSDAVRDVPSDRALAVIRQAVSNAIEQNLSTEFVYARTGFGLIHHGRKGVTAHVFYWSDWKGTAECHGWAEYAYGHAYEGLEPLDQAEPLFCGWDFPVLEFETTTWLEVAGAASSLENAQAEYVSRIFSPGQR
ncbi:MAG TPA: hypothetical protein VN238_06020 [Solirubrobacteraceae bacterium]|nr:hypothetical protein [Solirubrobacteraceae bacterium]